MNRCHGTRRNGERCTQTVEPPNAYCWHHAPERAEERRRAASKAGRSKPNRELPSIKALLEDLTERVLSGDLETGPAAVANQLINTRLRALEQERKVGELEDVLARLDALEEKQSQSQGNLMKGRNRW